MGIFDIFRKKPAMPATLEGAMASQANDFIDAFRGTGAPIDASASNCSRDSIALVFWASKCQRCSTTAT